MTLHAVRDIEDAIDTTRAFLLPFDRGRWLHLAVIAFFVAGGFGLNAPVNAGPSASAPPPESGKFPSLGELPVIPDDVLVLIGIVVLGAVALGLLLGLVASVMEFVLVASLREQGVHIRRYGREYLGAGFRLFGFRILTTAAGLAAVAGVALLVGPPGPVTGWTGPQLLDVALVAVPLLVVVLPLVALVNGLTTDFVVPVMVLEGQTVLGGWRRFWPTLRSNLVQYGAYLLLKFVLTIAVSIVGATAAGVGAVVLAIPFLLAGAVVFFAAGASLAGLSTGVAVVLIVLGLLYALSVAVLMAFIQVPLQTYLRYYALLVLGDTEEALDLIPDQRAAART